jgi:hypothetical protein
MTIARRLPVLWKVALDGPQHSGKAQVASRAVRKMSVFQHRGMATSPLWSGSVVAERESTGGGRHERPQFLE